MLFSNTLSNILSVREKLNQTDFNATEVRQSLFTYVFFQ